MGGHVLSSATDPALLPGEVLAGKYRVERVLGRGGMGVVLLAKNVLLGERVAIKILARGATPTSTSRLLMEARAAARLKSDHVVRVFDVGSTDAGEPYLVMEHLEGHPLSELLRRGGPVSAALAAHWVLQASEALAEAHRHGIIHRDVKPANLFLEQRPGGVSRIKVLDFGIAKLPDGENLATTTHAIGSPIYMAPEQLQNQRDVDARVDVWGIGCVLYELLTGAPPFAATSLLQLAVAVSAGSYPRVGSRRPDLPESLSAIVEKCLQPDRDARFSDLLALARALAPLAPPDGRALVERMHRVFGGSSLSATLEPELSPAMQGPGQSAREVDDPGSRSTPALTSARPPAPQPRRVRAAKQALLALMLLSIGSWVLYQRPSTPLPEEGVASAPVEAAEALRPSEPESGATESSEPRAASIAPSLPVAPTHPPAPVKPARRRPSEALDPRPLAPPAPGAAEPPARAGAPGPLPIDREPPW